MKSQKKIVILLTSVAIPCSVSKIDYTKLVNIGIGGHIHSYPGATHSHGMVQLSPDIHTWDTCSEYCCDTTTLIDLNQPHLSGTGIGDLADVLSLSFTNKIQAPKNEDKKTSIGFLFSRNTKLFDRTSFVRRSKHPSRKMSLKTNTSNLSN